MKRRRSGPPPQTENVLALSFLDVLSCGLGGAICLFLIFAVMPHMSSAGATTSSESKLEGEGLLFAQAGARADSLTQLVRSAPVRVEVHLAGAPDLSPGNGFWQGLPRRGRLGREAFEIREKFDAVVYHSPPVRGLNPEVPVRFSLRGISKAQNLSCTVRVVCGGVSRVSAIHMLSLKPDSNTVVVEIRLSEPIWIHFPGM